MALKPGTKLGPYEVLSQIGAGGMGEVYRARDTRLDRAVALKVLSSHLSSNPDLKQRFEREARAVSSLNHPHICTLYDIGQQDGVDYFVMEYLEGETLSERLKRGALPTEQVLRYAIEIADALEKAHRQGVVHRDLKPGNIMLTKSGTKLLDFGLAKSVTGAPADPGLTGLPTQNLSLTSPGTILGTFQYMAPEQLEGKEVDARTDIFAFGATLYETATGRAAFEGKSQASLIAAILEHEPPPITTIQPMYPPALDRVVKTCLAKDPNERWQTAHDMLLELKWVTEGGTQPAAPVTRLKRREHLGWIVAAVLFLVALALVWLYVRRSPAEMSAIRFTVPAPERASFGDTLAISPDGRSLAFVATDSEGRNRLWLRPLDSLAAQALPGTEGATFPFWSPDGHFIGFFADNKLKKIEVSGGPPQTLCDASQEARGGAWNRDGIIIFAPSFTDPLYKISSAGGPATPVTELDASLKETSHRLPHFLPDGRHFVYFARCSMKENEAVYVGLLDSKDRKRLFAGDSHVAYAAPGHLFFIRERTLMAQPFSSDKLQFTGEPFRVAEGVIPFGESGPTGYAPFSVSDNGVLAYRTGGDLNTQLVWVDRSGKQLGPASPPGMYLEPWLSPDEKRVAVSQTDSQTKSNDIWLIDLYRGLQTRFTFHPAYDSAPLWSPDGSRIVFASFRKGQVDLYQKVSSGAGSEELLLESKGNKFPDDWSRDGRFLIFGSVNPKTKFDLWVLPLFGDRKPTPFLQSEFNETHGRLSADGRWLAYVSDESGRAEVYVQTFPVSGGKWQISSSGGDQPAWRRDGKELFYLAADKKIMAVGVKAGSTFESEAPRPLIQTRVRDNTLTGDRNSYAVTSDGQRFLVVTPVSNSSPSPITVVLNWHSDLKH